MAEKSPASDAAVADVWRLIEERVQPLAPERVPLAQTRGRFLREEVKADADQPPFDRSAVDGYAFIPASPPARYCVIGTVKAGEVATQTLRTGEAHAHFHRRGIARAGTGGLDAGGGAPGRRFPPG